MAMVNTEEGVVENSDFNAVLGAGTSFEGKLVFEGQVRVAGKFDGEIYSDDCLQIDDTAAVQAEIHAGTVIVYGNVVGNIYATQLIALKSHAHVVGNIQAPALIIENGVVFEGSCRMENLDQADVVAEEPVAMDEGIQMGDMDASIDMGMENQ